MFRSADLTEFKDRILVQYRPQVMVTAILNRHTCAGTMGG